MTAQTQIMPLQGLKVVEFESIGPGPMCGRMLMGLGAQVTVIQRPTRPGVSAALPNSVPPELDLNHGKAVVELNLKTPSRVCVPARWKNSALGPLSATPARPSWFLAA
jgi:alpha-methylacyl-CoA racemase